MLNGRSSSLPVLRGTRGDIWLIIHDGLILVLVWLLTMLICLGLLERELSMGVWWRLVRSTRHRPAPGHSSRSSVCKLPVGRTLDEKCERGALCTEEKKRSSGGTAPRSSQCTCCQGGERARWSLSFRRWF